MVVLGLNPMVLEVINLSITIGVFPVVIEAITPWTVFYTMILPKWSTYQMLGKWKVFLEIGYIFEKTLDLLCSDWNQ
jgi:hypothetical protein